MKYSKRRNKSEIIIDVLLAINDPRMSGLKTRIMEKANLSWRILNDVLEHLLNKDLIEEADSPRTGKRSSNKDKRTKHTFKITEKGKELLRKYKVVKELLRVY